jgi:hypothetical protein
MTYVSFYTSLVNNIIYIIGRNARFDRSCRDVQDLSRQAADLSHSVYALLVQYRYFVAADKDMFASRYAVFSVIGPFDRLR